jgi:hypothetical protein
MKLKTELIEVFYNPRFNYYKTKSDTATCTGLIVIPSNTNVYNIFMSFIFTAYRCRHSMI